MNDREAIQQVMDRWKAATRAKDINAVKELITEDCIFLVTGAPATRGKEAVDKMMTAAYSRMDIEQDFVLEEVLITGDYAIGWGVESATATPAGGGDAMKFSGYSMTILRKENGSWKFARGLNGMKPI